jgi:hypothetical protein
MSKKLHSYPLDMKERGEGQRDQRCKEHDGGRGDGMAVYLLGLQILL